MQITSTAFQHKGNIPETYTCDGAGVNPPLEFLDVPTKAKSLVLIMDDPDVPVGVREDRMWDHWVVWNIAPETLGIEGGSEPAGVHGITTSGTLEYVPPCPPDKAHRYFFKLYALDTLLDLPEASGKADVEHAMGGHILAEAELMGLYNRSQN